MMVFRGKLSSLCWGFVSDRIRRDQIVIEMGDGMVVDLGDDCGEVLFYR